MKITISGKHMDLGEAFQQHVETRLQEGITKYIDRINVLDVVATKEGHRVRVDIHANTGTNSHVMVNGSGEAGDAYAAFDIASERIEKQLRRYKRRLTNHHKSRVSVDDLALSVQAKAYVISSQPEKEELEEEDAPVVIAERPMQIERLTVSEALMKLELANLPAMMFYNSAHGRVNLIYRREDGHIAWVDPEESAQKAA